MLMALAESWQQNRQNCSDAKARKFGVLLVAQLVGCVGSNVGVWVVGLSVENRFLAYLIIWRSGSFAASFAVVFSHSASAEFGAR